MNTTTLSVNYIKILVIEIDPLCESKIVKDMNCKTDEIETCKSELRKEYPDEDKYVTLALNQSMTIHSK